jgi:hypothetical protein
MDGFQKGWVAKKREGGYVDGCVAKQRDEWLSRGIGG